MILLAENDGCGELAVKIEWKWRVLGVGDKIYSLRFMLESGFFVGVDLEHLTKYRWRWSAATSNYRVGLHRQPK